MTTSVGFVSRVQSLPPTVTAIPGYHNIHGGSLPKKTQVGSNRTKETHQNLGAFTFPPEIWDGVQGAKREIVSVHDESWHFLLVQLEVVVGLVRYT